MEAQGSRIPVGWKSNWTTPLISSGGNQDEPTCLAFSQWLLSRTVCKPRPYCIDSITPLVSCPVPQWGSGVSGHPGGGREGGFQKIARAFFLKLFFLGDIYYHCFFLRLAPRQDDVSLMSWVCPLGKGDPSPTIKLHHPKYQQ